jgi:23S rRNA pseudouridine2605 synthase
MKLNAFLSRNGVCSRRKAVILVEEGRVTVNGRVVKEPWYEVGVKDTVAVNGHRVQGIRHVYLIINKPKGVTSTVDDPHAEKVVTGLVDPRLGRVYPVGRLDRDSRGLMVLTSDGDLCHKLTHPKYEVEKEYLVTVKGRADEALLKKVLKGAMSEGDLLKVRSARIEKSADDRSVISATICEGKKRHLRRLFGCLGLDVKDLVRVRIAGLKLGNLSSGKYRVLDRERLMALLGMKY